MSEGTIGRVARRIQVLDAVVEITCDDPAFNDLLDYVLRDVPTSHMAPNATVHLRALGEGHLEVIGDTPWTGLVAPDESMPRVITILNGLALQSVHDELCIHGAGAFVGDGLQALVAPSGVGKTTLLAMLMREGAGGLNDELLRLADDGRTARSWRKPLSIKKGTAMLFPDLAEHLRDSGKAFRHLPLSALGRVVDGPCPIRSVMLLRRVGRESACNKLGATTALTELVANTMNFTAVGPQRSLATLAGLVANTASYRVDVADVSAAARIIQEQALTHDAPSHDWEIISDTAPYMTAGVLTARIDHEVAVWSPETSRAIALDPVGTALWLEAAQGSSDRLLDAVPFVRGLVDHGMLNLERTADTIRRSGLDPV